MVAKLPSDDPTSRATSQAMQSYLIETSFYAELAPTLRVRAPGCHHVAYDPVTDDFTLLLEDLAPAEQGDQITGCSVDVAALAVGHLPELHAPRWGDPTLRDLAWLHRVTPDRVAFAGAMYLMLLDAFEQRYDGRIDPVHHRPRPAHAGPHPGAGARGPRGLDRAARRLPPRQPALRHRGRRPARSRWSTGRR